MDKLFLIDAYAIIYRSYYAFIKNPRINSKGLNTSAILGLCNTLHEVIEKEKAALEEERSHLGFFHGKRKKEIAAMLEKIPERIKQIEEEYEQEKKLV